MKPTPTFAVVLGSLLFGASLFFSVANAEEKYKPKEATELTVRTYRTDDLPVFTVEKEWRPSLLISLVQSSILPNSWEAKGGTSTMAPYPQNQSLVISTTSRGHDRIVDLLESLRD